MSLSGQQLLVRADANVQIGTGHVMRCLALAQAWQDAGGGVTFLSRPLPLPLETRLLAEGMAVVMLPETLSGPEDAAEAARQAEASHAAWVVVDGYQFDANYHKAIHAAGRRLLVFDDNGDAGYYWANLVLNQNIHAQADWYASRAPHTRLLLGTQYALLRREFLAWRGWKRDVPETAYKVLVTLGGSDPDNATLRVVEALSLVPAERLEATVVIGGGNPHRAILEAAAGRARFPIRLVTNAANMPELMAWTDIAVSAGGSTCWELAFMGLPTLIAVTAENQQGIAQGMDSAGAAVNLGWANDLTAATITASVTALRENPARRTEMSHLSRQIVDGQGTTRVLDLLHL